MSDREQMQKRREDDPRQVKPRLETLAEQSHSLREAAVSAGVHAGELRVAATRIVAHSRALRDGVLRARLPRDPTCGAIARRRLDEYLGRFPDEYLGRFPDDVVSDAKTVASELINNAYRHGEGTIELKVERHDRYVRIDVADEGPAGSERVLRSRGGHGLEIVDGLSLRWGAYAGSTHVWAMVPTSPIRVDTTEPDGSDVTL